jgi:gentisate 1,2-dioxygenase
MPTLRAEFHRIAAGASTAPHRETGSSVFQVFEGTWEVSVGEAGWRVERGDLFVVPSWQALGWTTDAPILEKLHQYRTETGQTGAGLGNQVRHA